MNRNEYFPMLEVSSLSVHLAWATLEVRGDSVDQLQVLVSGGESDTAALRITCAQGHLLIEQPNLGISPSLATAGHWMEILIRVPLDWKGPLDLSTISGRLTASGLNGTDLELCTVSGALSAGQLGGIRCHLRTVSGALRAEGVTCNELVLRSVSGNVTMEDSVFSQGNLDSVSGDFSLSLLEPIDLLNVTTVSGGLALEAPITSACIRRKAPGGHLRTKGLSLQDQGVPISMTTVSGDLEIIGGAG